MNIRSIMVPAKELICLSINNTIKEAIEMMESKDLLSLPVVNGKLFVGLLSRQYIYETYFKSSENDREDYLNKKVQEFIKTTIPTANEHLLIEEAATFFLDKKLRFLPVTNDKGELIGIVTHKAIFKEFQKVQGLKLPKIIIYTYDFKGILAKICDVINKAGGNIKNVVQKDTEVMGLQEISFRIDCKDIKKIIKALKNNDIEVRYYTEG